MVLCSSVPKAGTHLLERVICLHPGVYRKLRRKVFKQNLDRYGGEARVVRSLRPGQMALTHLHWSERLRAALAVTETRALFMVRDPRAMVVSYADYVASFPRHTYSDALAGLDRSQRIAALLDGVPGVGPRPFADELALYAGWLDAPDVLVVRFEDLVGPRGGGCEARQRATIEGIYGHLGLASNDRLIAAVSRQAFGGPSATFSHGKIDRWRTVLTGELGVRANEELSLWADRFAQAAQRT
jgi:hypothetical protein